MLLEGVLDQFWWTRVGNENAVISFSPDFPKKNAKDELLEYIKEGILKGVICPAVQSVVYISMSSLRSAAQS